MPISPRTTLLSVLLLSVPALAGCWHSAGPDAFAHSASADYTVELAGRLRSTDVMESSGFALANAHGDLWTHGDGGGAAALYKVTPQGELLQTLYLDPLVNIDWEDLTRDDEGRLYIGDFGNNQNKRRNLCIYRLSGPELRQVDTIRFRYPDQRRFPPRKSARNFDCEAFFAQQDSLYLFTKNRGKGHYTKLYSVPARPGFHVASLLDSIRTTTWITAADISPDGRTVALLGHNCLYLIRRQPGRRLFDGLKSTVSLPDAGQAEALAFVNNTDLVFSNEKGRIFWVKHK